MTPLHFASMNNHLPVVQHLIERGAKIDSESEFGNTAIDYAKLHHHFNIVNYLAQQGAHSAMVPQNGSGFTHLSVSIRLCIIIIVLHLTVKDVFKMFVERIM
jgi:ankyrin repeat protein